MSNEKKPENFHPMESNLTDDDFALADQILDSLVDDPMCALKKYMRAKPEVKRILGNVDPRTLLVQVDPNIEDKKIVEYFNADANGDELGMKRAYQGSNKVTQHTIDELKK